MDREPNSGLDLFNFILFLHCTKSKYSSVITEKNCFPANCSIFTPDLIRAMSKKELRAASDSRRKGSSLCPSMEPGSRSGSSLLVWSTGKTWHDPGGRKWKGVKADPLLPGRKQRLCFLFVSPSFSCNSCSAERKLYIRLLS